MEILNLKEAAALIRASNSTMRELAASKRIRGRKIGKAWRFFKDELEEDIRKLNLTEDTTDPWESSQEKIVATGGSRTKTQLAREYANQLKLSATARTRKN